MQQIITCSIQENLTDSIVSPPSITLRGRIVEFDRPWVMGILNITPDSFYAPSRVTDPREIVRRARAMLKAGADILDIGACSTRPGSESAGEEEELQRLVPALDALRNELPDAIISVDTFRAKVAEECIRRWNADIINDISGGEDPEMFATVAAGKAGYVLMHMRGTPSDMDSRCAYGSDIVADVVRELAFKLDRARQAQLSNVIVDPGFGFAKTTEQNLVILKRLSCLKELGCPIMVGISRKRMAREAGGSDAADSLTATIALNAVALMNGASIIRVHDVEEGYYTAESMGKLWRVSE